MAQDPLVLLDDPAFSMDVSPGENGEAALEFDSLPSGFDVLAAPQRSNRQAAQAMLRVGSPPSSSGEGPDDVGAVVGSLSAGLDNPLTNLNLTEGSTVTPSHVGSSDAWVVSFPASNHRTVVWSPDGTTWVALNWTGPEDELLAIANAVTFTEQAGEWMTGYDVDLPAIPLDFPPVPVIVPDTTG